MLLIQEYDQSSHLVKVECDKGERIYVEAKDGGNLYGKYGESSFSGFLLRRYD